MNRYAISIIACLTWLFASCTQEAIDTEQPSSKPLSINVKIDSGFGGTRSAPTGTPEQQTCFREGDLIGVSIYDVRDKNNKNLVLFRKSGNEWLPMNGKRLDWPNNAELVIVDAFYPVEHTTEADGSNQAGWSGENASFLAPGDQRTTHAENDIAWADHMTCRSSVRIENRETPVDLLFHRRMAKVNIRITSLDEQWDPDNAWVSIDELQTQIHVKKFYPANGGELMLNSGEATCLLPLGEWYAGNTHPFCTLSIYDSRGLTTGKTTMRLFYTPPLSAGKACTLNLKIGKQKAEVEQFTIEPWGGKVTITDAVGPTIPVMIVKDGLAHIYLDRAMHGTAQIADSIASAESQKHQVHDLVFYGNMAGKLTLGKFDNMIRHTNIRSLDLSHVTDLTEITAEAFKVNSMNDFDKLEEVVLPLSVTTIGAQAFYKNGIKRIITPGVEEVGEEAFRECSFLTKVSFPRLGIIKQRTFYRCLAMAEADFAVATEIGERAFYQSSLSGGKDGKVNFPGVTQIFTEAFAYSSLTGGAFAGGTGEPKTGLNVKDLLLFPEVQQIDTRAFLGCSQLVAVSFPKAVRFHDYIFSGCGSLAALKITARGEMYYLGADHNPFGRDYLNYPESQAGEDYNPARNDPYMFGVGTLYVHTDKMLDHSSFEIRVRDYVHTIGYGDNRGQAKFGGYWNQTSWQELVYVDDLGRETWAHTIH